MAEMPSGWEARGKPPTLFRRFSFGTYSETRAFLDALAALSEETGIHPQNINFGTTYANVTLEAAEGETLTEVDAAFARRIDALTGAA
jgi:pterin-4a-carbinolamine dehydratase